MVLPKAKTTTKKFYGKWLYKSSLTMEGCYLFRNKSLEQLEKFCLEPCIESAIPGNLYYPWANTLQQAWNNRTNILKLVSFLKLYSHDTYGIRVESFVMDIYSNDRDFYEKISSKFIDILRSIHEPNTATLDLLNSKSNCVIVNKLPKDRYNYRVFLLPHKMKGNQVGKVKFLDWLRQQAPRITCTERLAKWFLITDWNWDRRYILVEDEQSLLMLKLRNPDVVGRTYNFIITDK